MLRNEREQTQSEMEELEVEKRAIKSILTKVMYELQQVRESLDFKYKEVEIYSSAIQEIGQLLFFLLQW